MLLKINLKNVILMMFKFDGRIFNSSLLKTFFKVLCKATKILSEPFPTEAYV